MEAIISRVKEGCAEGHGAPSMLNKHEGYLSAWMRSAGTSTSVTPRKEKSSFTRYLGGCSAVCFTIWATASVTAAWNITPSAWRPARFTLTSCPGCNIVPPRKSSACQERNASESIFGESDSLISTKHANLHFP